MGLVLELLIAINLLIIIVKCTNCSNILALKFLPSQFLVPSSARYRLEHSCFYTADSVQTFRSSKAALKDRIEISCQWHNTFRNFQPQIPDCHAPLLEISAPSWLSVIKSAVFFPDRGQSNSCFLFQFVISIPCKARTYSCSDHHSAALGTQFPPV